MDVLKRPIILASKSPRRKQLLSEAGFNFVVKTKDVEEDYPDDIPAGQLAEYLANKKAMACAEFIQNEEVLIAADSIVVLNDVIYEKPKDRTDAVRILTELSGNAHDVITGVCLLTKDKKINFSAISRVFLDPLSADEINYYVDNFKPYDKAGAYAIQEWVGHCKIEKIEGTYTNIMGLPVARIYKYLQDI